MPRPRAFLIGRSRQAHLVLAYASVSDLHAELSVLPGGRVLLSDRNSTNGTYRIGPDGQAERLRHGILGPDDTLRFGRLTLPARALFAALGLDPATPAAPATPAQPPGPARPAAGARLIRGPCGHIKPAGGPCPECGQ
jgi:hypothetical protein